jgi:hypothetical protein
MQPSWSVFRTIPESPVYSSAKPAGEYFYSPTATDLGGVFQQVASEILRISQ